MVRIVGKVLTNKQKFDIIVSEKVLIMLFKDFSLDIDSIEYV